MKKILVTSLLALLCYTAPAQVNGIVLSDSANLCVVKVWGSHYERGFAYGYLCAAHIKSIYEGYYMQYYGDYLDLAHDVVAGGQYLSIDSVYFEEARGVMAGMDSADIVVDSMDYIDLIVGNCLLDLMNALNKEGSTGMGCSSLMSWGSATLGMDLNGHSAITRHLDWQNDPELVANQVIVAHIPSEIDEQPWVMIGFAGQISALSGVNQHIGVFQHMLSDFSGSPVIGTLYEPIWFSLRKALEKNDYNNDGAYNTKDVHDVLAVNTNGYADGYIICTLAPSTAGSSTLIAEVAEIAPVAPFLTFRDRNFADSIVGDNLYAANYEIKRNSHYHFCQRYNAVISGLKYGDSIGIDENWDIMETFSVSASPMGNIQMMQYVPEEDLLRLSVQKHGRGAFMNAPDSWSISGLLSHPASLMAEPASLTLSLWPSPATEMIRVCMPLKKPGDLTLNLRDITGKLLLTKQHHADKAGNVTFSFPLSGLKPGIYLMQVVSREGNACGKFIINK